MDERMIELLERIASSLEGLNENIAALRQEVTGLRGEDKDATLSKICGHLEDIEFNTMKY